MGNLQDAATFLKQQILEGKRWIVFEDQMFPAYPQFSKYFDSSISAAAACDIEPRYDPEAGDLVSYNYKFDAIENVLADISSPSSVINPSMEAQSILRHQMLKENLSFEKSDDEGPLLTRLYTGKIVPVFRQYRIVPKDFIEQYYLVEHTHFSTGLFYELGHSSRILESFTELTDARERQQSRLEQTPLLFNTHTELIIVGQYKNSNLYLDIEGCPQFNSGIALSRASTLNGKLFYSEICDPTLQQAVKHKIFIKLNESKSGFILLNDRLEVFNPRPGMTDSWNYNLHPNSLAPIRPDHGKVVERITEKPTPVRPEAGKSWHAIQRLRRNYSQLEGNGRRRPPNRSG